MNPSLSMSIARTPLSRFLAEFGSLRVRSHSTSPTPRETSETSLSCPCLSMCFFNDLDDLLRFAPFVGMKDEVEDPSFQDGDVAGPALKSRSASGCAGNSSNASSIQPTGRPRHLQKAEQSGHGRDLKAGPATSPSETRDLQPRLSSPQLDQTGAGRRDH